MGRFSTPPQIPTPPSYPPLGLATGADELAHAVAGLDIDQLAAMTKRPQDVAGAHFFSPANVMKLLEVVRGAESSPTTLRVLATLIERAQLSALISRAAGGYFPAHLRGTSENRW